MIKQVLFLLIIILLIGCTKTELKDENKTDSLLEDYYSKELKEETSLEEIKETPKLETNKKSDAEKLRKILAERIKEYKKNTALSEEKNETLLQEDNSYYIAGYDLYQQGDKELKNKEYSKARDYFKQAEEMLNRI